MEARPLNLRKRRDAGEVPVEASGRTNFVKIKEPKTGTRNVGRPMAKNGKNGV